ncbi:MAG: hypothetical protein AAGF45_10935 [Pseudomonadota bacterium]
MSGTARRLGETDATPLAAFTFRELLNQKRLAERAARRRGTPEAEALLGRIVDELEARRTRKFARHAAPDI